MPLMVIAKYCFFFTVIGGMHAKSYIVFTQTVQFNMDTKNTE